MKAQNPTGQSSQATAVYFVETSHDRFKIRAPP